MGENGQSLCSGCSRARCFFLCSTLSVHTWYTRKIIRYLVILDFCMTCWLLETIGSILRAANSTVCRRLCRLVLRPVPRREWWPSLLLILEIPRCRCGDCARRSRDPLGPGRVRARYPAPPSLVPRELAGLAHVHDRRVVICDACPSSL